MRIVSICLNPTIDVYSEADAIFAFSKVRTHAQKISPGGGGVNVARVLSDFQVSCELIYMSGGATGILLDHELQHYDIHKRAFKNDSPTRVAYTVHLPSKQQEFRFVPDGPVVSPETWRQLLKHVSSIALDEHDVVVASGSLPTGIPDDAYAQIAEVVRHAGARFVLDSSGLGLSRALEGRHEIFLIKPSLRELQHLADKKLDESEAREFARQMVADGRARNVAVSLGSHGAFMVTQDGVLRSPAQLVKVHSAVGAGDSFVGAMIYSLSQGHTIETAFHYGLAGGAAAVMTTGDQLCKPEDVQSLYQAMPSTGG